MLNADDILKSENKSIQIAMIAYWSIAPRVIYCFSYLLLRIYYAMRISELPFFEFLRVIAHKFQSHASAMLGLLTEANFELL